MSRESLRIEALHIRARAAQGPLGGDARTVELMLEHIAALEAEAAQARDRTLEEVVADHRRRAEAARDFGDTRTTQAWWSAAEAVTRLKSKPAQEPCRCEFPEAGECRIPEHAPKPVEMASEENDLLPKRRSREHEYGVDSQSHFGSWVANCVRPRCPAFRVKNRKKTSTMFRQDTEALPTDEPGPCVSGVDGKVSP